MYGYPLSETYDGLVVWQFPEGKTGIISKEDASYLTRLSLGLCRPDANHKFINVIR